MQEAQIEDGINFKKKLDILFCGQTLNKPLLSFEGFIEILAKVAEVKYPDVCQSLGVKEGFNALLHRNFLPLYDRIDTESRYGKNARGVYEAEVEVDELVTLVLRPVSGVLLDIYKVYFPWELKTSESDEVTQNRSLRSQFQFLRDYDICPSLINKSIAFQIWHNLVESQCKEVYTPEILLFGEENSILMIGTVFTYSKFIDYLVSAAIRGYELQGEGTPLSPYLKAGIIYNVYL